MGVSQRNGAASRLRCAPGGVKPKNSCAHRRLWTNRSLHLAAQVQQLCESLSAGAVSENDFQAGSERVSPSACLNALSLLVDILQVCGSALQIGMHDSQAFIWCRRKKRLSPWLALTASVLSYRS